MGPLFVQGGHVAAITQKVLRLRKNIVLNLPLLPADCTMSIT